MKKMKMYEIKIISEKSQACVILSINDNKLKKWKGVFAQLIINEICNRSIFENGNNVICENHFHIFLNNVSKLYYKALIYYNIENTITPFKISKDRCNIAKFLLLHIRLNEQYLSNDELFSNFLDEFPNSNFLKYYELIDFFIENKLINTNQLKNKKSSSLMYVSC
jgi:hypothetical protein